jgi:hypothetical protein
VTPGGRIPHADWAIESQSLVRKRPAGRGSSPPIFPFHNGFLFSRLQIGPETNIFNFFALPHSRSTADGCYIDFSGFSASRALYAQDSFLNTTYVTAGTTANPRPQDQ